jgi:hypothetical protein
MGVFNLSMVLPQLAVSLGVGSIISAADDKGMVFVTGAVSVGLSALCWLAVSDSRHAAPAGVPAAAH